MKERTDGGSLIKPKGTRKFCADIDVLRTEEWKRRRLLRLEQVRQQSKDIASDIRNKVRLEKNGSKENFQKRTEIAASKWKEQKLTALQNELTETLSYVGSAHKQAEYESKQEESKQLVKNHLVEAADRRGREAILRLRSDELARKQAEQARKLQQQHVRSVEEARTAVVVSLPAPKSTVPVGVVPRVSKPEVVKKDRTAESNCKQWPTKPWPVSIPLGVTPANVDDIDRTSHSAKSVVTQETKDDSSACLPPTQGSTTASTAASVGDASIKASSSNLTARESRRNIAASKTDKEPKGVELYDCTNGSHVHYTKASAVSISIPAGPVDGLEAAEACSSNSNVKKDASRSSTAKRIERGKEALKRVQARREHQALLTELAGLVRQQAALRSLIPEPEDPKMIQKKLNEAVADILKEAPEVNVQSGNFGRKKTEPVPAEAESVSVETCSEEGEIIIDVCSQDETIVTDKRQSKEDRTKGEENLAAGIGRRSFEQDQSVATNPEGESPGRTAKEESLSANETSVGSDVPQLNLALWTSHSPGSTNLGDKTLTPSEKQNMNSSGDTDQRDKTLTPSEGGDKNKLSKRSSLSSAADDTDFTIRSDVKIKIDSSGRISPTDKYSGQKEKGSGKDQRENRREASNERHMGSGDFVTVASRRKQKIPSPPKADETNFERETPRQPLSEERRRSKKVSPSSSSTSYMSLPNKLLSAITEDLRSLLSLTRRRQNVDGSSHTNPLLAHYIHRLLDMSRQSVERLNVVTSEIPTPPSAVFRNGSYDSSRPSISLPIDETDKRSVVVSSSTDTTKTTDVSSSSESSELVTVMRQCHERISSLSQMIERVRQENVVSTLAENKRSPSLHLESTAYLSPPSSVMPSPQMLPRNVELPGRNNPLDDTYGAVITRLVSEIRQQLAREADKPLQINLTPPHGPTRNVKSSSSNELSTIPEQDSSSLEWSSVIISSETGGSSEEVEKEFSRMGLGWAGATLRKTKEACTLDSNSSSDLLELSALSLFGSYSHSTPIKMADDKQSRT